MHAGNTLFFEKLRYQRRRVNATLAWPSEAAASRPPGDVVVESIEVQELAAALGLYADQQVLWLGDMFNVTGLDDALEQRLIAFDKEIQLCPEC